MRNIIQIFLRDIRKIKGNTIAMIIMVGILVVPTLYAWFNIGGSWDPYENTSDIKIAVASDDAGYQGELLPLDINPISMKMTKWTGYSRTARKRSREPSPGNITRPS